MSMLKAKLAGLKGKKAGFTLVEILVVILIIGLLFVFLVPKISNATDKARETGIKTDMHSYQVAFESVAKENSGFGENVFTGADAGEKSKALLGAVNGYLDPALQICTVAGTPTGAEVGDTLKKDPWNNVYKVEATVGTGNDGSVSITSYGKDSVAGGTGTDYVLTTEYDGGALTTETTGFSTNIKK